jgi:hypothetical protein
MIPKVFKPKLAPVLTTALIQAFIPGESPPDVNTAIFFIPNVTKSNRESASKIAIKKPCAHRTQGFIIKKMKN